MERITSLDLLAVLAKPRRLMATFAARVHYPLMVNLLPTRTPRAFPQKAELLSSLLICSMYWCLGLFSPRCGTSETCS